MSETIENSSQRGQQQTYLYEPLVPEKTDSRDKRGRTYKSFTTAIIFSAILPLVALIVWASHAARKPWILQTFAGAQIGGKLSQGQAKALDVICGALFGPLLMATLNLIWFSSAHVIVINEQTRKDRGVPLVSLVAVSSTSSGSFDLFNLYNLVRGRTWRLCLFAALTVLSAIARSSFCNIIAYEAYFADHDFENVATLRMLNDQTIRQNTAFIAADPIKTYNYTLTQQADISGMISALLTGLTFRAASSLLVEGDAYIGMNATSNSINGLPSSILRLVNVPAYRLTTECEPALASSLAVMQFGGYSTKITALWHTAEKPHTDTAPSTTEERDGMLLTADYPGLPANIQGAYNEYYAFAGFSPDKSETVLAYMSGFNETQHIVPSMFGDVHPGVFNMTFSGFRGSKSMMTAWGIRCALYRQEGNVNYSRADNQQWEASSVRFESGKRRVPSFLGDWQLALNYNAPGAVIPGLGPPLATTAGVPCEGPSCFKPLDFGLYAHNFLYASASTEKAMHNVAAADAARDLPEYFYSVGGGAEEEFYRITYVPLILLVGLLSLIGATGITGAMLVYTSGTLSTRSFRQVDVLRLVFDGVLDLWSDTPTMAKTREQDNGALKEWAKRYFISYTEEEEGGRRVVRLTSQERI